MHLRAHVQILPSLKKEIRRGMGRKIIIMIRCMKESELDIRWKDSL